eukprot:s845_g1.t1
MSLSRTPSSLSQLRSPSRSATPASQMAYVEQQPIFPALPLDRAGCPSGIQFRPERRAEDFVHPFLQKPVYTSMPTGDTGYSNFVKRGYDTQLFSRSYAKGNWEAARLGMPKTLMLSRSIPTIFTQTGQQTLNVTSNV